MAPEGPAPDGEMLAALDIGTNSFHMVIARIRGNGFEVVTREKDTVRLGHGGGDMKRLEPEAIERGVEALKRLQRLAASHGATVRAVATSAVREAENAAEFLHRAKQEAGVEVEVISGLEEARLIQLGVLQAVPVFDRRLMLIDIGGGSTEILIGQRGETIAARSFKLGAVRLTDRFFPGGASSSKSVAACRSYIGSTLATYEREVRDAGFEVVTVSSGTGETVARMISAARGEAERHTYNCFEFTRQELDSVVELLVSRRTASSRRTLHGLDPARADIAVAGALVLQGVAGSFKVKRFTFSEGALREGVLLDSIARRNGGGLHHLRDVSRSSIAALASRCDDDPVHSANVARLALELFDGTQILHGLGPEAREYLEAGALLANVGLVIAHSKHHLHAYYVVRNCELTGLTDQEIELIALIARYHRKSAPKASHPEFARLSADDQHLVRVLAGLLRVAIGLDRTHDGRISRLRVTMRGHKLTVHAATRRGRDIALELYTANERTALLAEVLGCQVEVVAATHPSSTTTTRSTDPVDA